MVAYKIQQATGNLKSGILLNLMFKIAMEGNRDFVSVIHLPRIDEETGSVDFLKVQKQAGKVNPWAVFCFYPPLPLELPGS